MSSLSSSSHRTDSSSSTDWWLTGCCVSCLPHAPQTDDHVAMKANCSLNSFMSCMSCRPRQCVTLLYGRRRRRWWLQKAKQDEDNCGEMRQCGFAAFNWFESTIGPNHHPTITINQHRLRDATQRHTGSGQEMLVSTSSSSVNEKKVKNTTTKYGRGVEDKINREQSEVGVGMGWMDEERKDIYLWTRIFLMSH